MFRASSKVIIRGALRIEAKAKEESMLASPSYFVYSSCIFQELQPIYQGPTHREKKWYRTSLKKTLDNVSR
jgi:hypothetical protein